MLIILCTQNAPPFSRFALRVIGDPVLSTRGHIGVGIAVIMQSECALLNWIRVSGRLCAVRLGGFAGVNSVVVCSLYLCLRPLIAAPLRPKTSFTGTCRLFRSARSTYFVVVVDDFNTQLGCFAEMERQAHRMSIFCPSRSH